MSTLNWTGHSTRNARICEGIPKRFTERGSLVYIAPTGIVLCGRVAAADSTRERRDRATPDGLQLRKRVRGEWENGGDMLVLLNSGYEEMSQEAARIVAGAVRS